MVAFRATLEELESADLLLHVIDISNLRFKDQIESVERILAELNLNHLPSIRVLNKQDLLDKESAQMLRRNFEGIPISAKDESTLMDLIKKMEMLVQGTH